MSAFFPLVWREALRRSWFLAFGVAAGLGAVVLVPEPGKGYDPSIGFGLLALSTVPASLLVAFLAGLLVLGKAQKAEEDAPCGGFAHWLARLVASLVLISLTALVGLGILAIVYRQLQDPIASYFEYGLALMIADLVLIALAAGFSLRLAFRSRPPLLLADLGLFGLLAFSGIWLMAYAYRQNLLPPDAWLPARTMAYIALATLLAIGIAAWMGREQESRGRLPLSIAMWSGVALVVGGHGVWLLRALDIGPPDLEYVAWTEPSPDGKWVLATGPVRGREALTADLLVRLEGGFIKANLGLETTAPAFASDGSAAAWLMLPEEPHGGPVSPETDQKHKEGKAGGATPAVVRTVDLRASSQAPAERVLGAPAPAGARTAIPSAGLEHILLASPGTLARFDLRTGARAFVVEEKEARWWDPLTLLPDGSVHAYRATRDVALGKPGTLEIVEIAPDGTASVSGRFDVRGAPVLRAGPAEGTLLVIDAGTSPAVRVLDGRSGELRQAIASTAAVEDACAFGGNAIVLVESAWGRLQARLVDTSGGERWTSDLGAPGAGVRLVSADGVVEVGIRSLTGTGGETLVLDAATGAIKRREKGLLPLPAAARGFAVAGKSAPAVFLDARGALVLGAASGGAGKVLVGEGAAR